MKHSAFFDTNIFLDADDDEFPAKKETAIALVAEHQRLGLALVSIQVLQEYYVTVTQKLDPGMSTNDARDDVKAYLAWQPRGVDRTVIESAWEIQDRFGFSWWDSTIVAAAKLRDCTWLLSEDPFNTEIPTER